MTATQQNSRTWHFLRSAPAPAAWNMAVDEALLAEAARLGRPILRFYSWTEPAATFGYFQKHEEIERLTLLRPIVRRVTGGGLVPHDADWTYSLVAPGGHEWYALKATESYERIHEWIRSAFSRLGIAMELAPCCRKDAPGQCFIGYEKSDVLWHGKKVAGAAQRRTKEGLLIQGSVQPPPLQIDRSKWEEAMLEVAVSEQGVDWIKLEPSTETIASADILAGQKYSQLSHNQRR